MIFELKIDCGNAAHDDANVVELVEVARLLHHAGDRVSEGNLNFWINDENGNRVGEARLTDFDGLDLSTEDANEVLRALSYPGEV